MATTEKTLVHLRVPAIELEVDALLPRSASTDDVVDMLVRAAGEVSRGFFCPTGEEVACVARLGVTLMPGTNLMQYPIQNGDEVVLI